MTTPLERLMGGFYNSDPVSEANPGGFGDGGHVVNFPAALADIGAVADGIVLDAEAIAEAGQKADEAAASAEAAQLSAEEIALIASGRTVRSGDGPPADGLGRAGDFYIDRTASALYGPKAAGWGTATSLIGPTEEVEFRVETGIVEWRREGGAWIALITLAELSGTDAEEVSLRTTATHIQWRRGTAAWIDLIALDALAGADAEAISLQANATHIQWRVGTGAWMDLVALTSLSSGGGSSVADLWFYGA